MKKLFGGLLVIALLVGSFLPVHAEKFTIKKGAASQTIYFRAFDSSSTTGGSLTGLAYNTGSLVCYYVRVLGSATQITLATQTVTGAYSSGGFVEVDATNMPGIYRLDLPDAVIATGVDRATVLCKGAANMVPVQVDIELVAYDPQAATNLGLSGLPTANPGASGGLPTTDANNAVKVQSGTAANQIDLSSGQVKVQSGTGAGQLDLTSGRIKSDLSHWNGTAVAAPDTAGYPKVTIKDGTGTGEIDTASGKISIADSGISPTSYQTAGTISAESGTTLSLSGGVAANDQYNYQAKIVVYAASGGAIEASSCIVDTINGSPDQVITAEDVTAFIATSDPFDIVPDAACAALRPATLGRTANIDASGRVTVGSNADKTGYSLTQTFPTNFSSLAITGGGAVTAGTVSDKTGYALTAGEHTAISGDVWGALRSSYTAAGTFGQGAQIIRSGTAQAGASTTITLDASASAVNDFYINSTLTIISGTGAGQTRQVTAYVGSSKVATVNAAWATNPASDSVFLITANGINPAVSGITPADIWTYAGGRSLTDKAGFSLTQAFPTNFASMAITAGGQLTVGTNNDKSGYSLSQSFPTNFANLVIDANGRVDLSRWLGGTPNALISGRVDANAQVVGDKTGYALTQAFPANFSTLSIDVNGRTDLSKVLGVSLSAQVGSNFNTFWQNGGNVTTKVVDDVGGGGAGTTDWTTTERNQIRYRLGIDGATATPAATQNLGNLNINFAQALPGSPTADTIGRALKYADTRLEAARPTGAIVAGAANCNGGTNSAATFATNLSYTATNHFDKTELITFESGALAGQSAQITGYTWTGAVGCVTVSTTLGLTATPGVGDSFVIVNK